MKFKETDIEGLYLITPLFTEDKRGNFVKTFHADAFAANNLEFDFRESFFSESFKGVLRGMHFHWPPFDHAKLVYCISGEVVDVVVDIRRSSKTYGQCRSFNLNDRNKESLYIPRGFAHGFCAMSDVATMVYLTTTEYNREHDTGIRYDSFDYDWPVENPIVSERDMSFITLDELETPFV